MAPCPHSPKRLFPHCWLIGLAALFLPPEPARATADGPDLWTIRSDAPVALRAEPEAGAEVLEMLPPDTPDLPNLGCVGRPSFATWSAMSPAERIVARDRVWCETRYFGRVGWIAGKHLAEQTVAGPSFDCAAADGSVEALICDRPALALLDRLMARTFDAALRAARLSDAGAEAAAARLRAAQRGWIKGRNDCWKADEADACVRQSIERRIAVLQAEWSLGDTGPWIVFGCGDRVEIAVRLVDTDTLPAASIEFADRRLVMTRARSADGARYAGAFGTELWIKGREARFTPVQTAAALVCRERSR